MPVLLAVTITMVRATAVPSHALPLTDLRAPTDKSVRQLYPIIKYGVPATGMRHSTKL